MDLEAILRAFLVWNPQSVVAWQQLYDVLRDGGEHDTATEALLRSMILEGFSRGGHTLFYQARRAELDFDRVAWYFRDRQGLSEAWAEVANVVEKVLLDVRLPQFPSSAAFEAEARSRLPLVEARVLRSKGFSEVAQESPAVFEDAVVTNALGVLLLAHGAGNVVSDEILPDEPETRAYLRLRDDETRTIDEAFLVGRSANHYDWLIETSRNLQAYVEFGSELPFLTLGPDPTAVQAEMFALLGVTARAAVDNLELQDSMRPAMGDERCLPAIALRGGAFAMVA